MPSKRLPVGVKFKFIPYAYGYDFKVIVTKKCLSAKKALALHNGRGAQEGVFAELKSQTQMDYVPTRRKVGNQVYLLAAVLAHNLNREMQMRCCDQRRNTTEKRAPRWQFEQIGTLEPPGCPTRCSDRRLVDFYVHAYLGSFPPRAVDILTVRIEQLTV